jgi:RNA polymerase sigma-70 factor (ECF subfamily)
VNPAGEAIPLTDPTNGPTFEPSARGLTTSAAADEPSVANRTVDDAGGFETFYADEHGSMVRALTLALGDADLAADAADEAFVRAYERWVSVSGLDRPGGWVYRVGLNWATSVLRRRRRHDRLYAAEPAAAGGDVVDPAVQATLAELNVDQRAVVVCRYWLGWTVPEIAASLGLREGTVKSRLHRAHKALSSRLADHDPGPCADPLDRPARPTRPDAPEQR